MLTSMNDIKKHPSSYRDPSGFIFEMEGKFYRQVNKVYAAHYDLLKSSGLYDALLKDGAIISHKEINENYTGNAECYLTLLPEQLSFISYPYEWCFEQWKDAALLTLYLVKKAMAKGMMLKDATAFNIQFVNGKPVLIDILSFEKYDASQPWVAYRQFIECFIAPLLIARYNKPDLLKIFQLYPEGIPVQVLTTLLPAKSKLNLNVLMHISLPGMVANKPATKQTAKNTFTEKKLGSIISNLESFVHSIEVKQQKTNWDTYYEETILSKGYFEEKKRIVAEWLDKTPVNSVLDLGCNTGAFSLIASERNRFTIAVDADTACVNALYKTCRQEGIANVLPLCIDITNPSPAIGWNNSERSSFLSRAKTELTLALALVHHLCIGRNISIQQVADTFSKLSPLLIIEFISKDDPKVQQMLSYREDIFNRYTQEDFEHVFTQYYNIIEKTAVSGTARTLYLMQRQ